MNFPYSFFLATRNTFFGKQKTKYSSIFLIVFTFFTFARIDIAYADLNAQINYQGKLADSGGTAVANGTYNMRFKLYNASTSGSLLWTETRTSGDKVTVTNGLFSIMLGSVNSFAGVDFNQALYLSVEIGGTSTPGWMEK